MWSSALRITPILSTREKAAALAISDPSELKTEGHRASKSTEDDRVPEERPVDQELKEPSMEHPEAEFLGPHSQGSIPLLTSFQEANKYQWRIQKGSHSGLEEQGTTARETNPESPIQMWKPLSKGKSTVLRENSLRLAPLPEGRERAGTCW